ncbi:MAG: SH3 domain-containing protein [Alphaproteobacteria bacterium]
MFRRALLLSLLLAAPAFAQDASILNPSGLPIPRFVTLKSDEVNVRVGPGERYPIRWVYHRAHLPVQVIEEFAHWRKIKDYEGSVGWVQQTMISGERDILIMDKPQNLYAEAEVTSAPIIRAAPMVTAKLLACRPDWCRVELAGRKAWIRKADIWGVTREEVF